MDYSVVTLLDEDDEELGLFTLKTNIGEMVILFSDQSALDTYLTVARDQAFVQPSAATRRARKFGLRHYSDQSVDDIRQDIMHTNPGLQDAVFVTDQHEDFHALMEGLTA